MQVMLASWMLFATFVYLSPYIGVSVPIHIATAMYALMLIIGVIRILLSWLMGRDKATRP